MATSVRPSALKELAIGDILIEGRMHSMLWVGGEKPLVHNVDGHTDGAKTVGVIRQSTSYLDKIARCTVYRYRDGALARRAAEFAVAWATPSDANPSDADAFRITPPGAVDPPKRVLKSPYSHKRMTDALEKSTDVPWSVESLFRVIKAIARMRDGAGLSPNHGVSCSQFVTYCYQAAALEHGLGPRLDTMLTAAVRDDARRTERPFDLDVWKTKDLKESNLRSVLWRDRAFAVQRKVFHSLQDWRQNTLVHDALSHADTQSMHKNLLPNAMQVDAKFRTVDRLIDDLDANDSGFTKLGRTVKGEDGSYRYADVV